MPKLPPVKLLFKIRAPEFVRKKDKISLEEIQKRGRQKLESMLQVDQVNSAPLA